MTHSSELLVQFLCTSSYGEFLRPSVFLHTNMVRFCPPPASLVLHKAQTTFIPLPTPLLKLSSLCSFSILILKFPVHPESIYEYYPFGAPKDCFWFKLLRIDDMRNHIWESPLGPWLYHVGWFSLLAAIDLPRSSGVGESLLMKQRVSLS